VLLAVLAVLVIGAMAVVIGMRFGIVVAPRLGRLLDRADPSIDASPGADDDKEPRDRAD
jgi:hypothetical protein